MAEQNDADLIFLTALAKQQAGQSLEAARMYREVLSLQPDHVPALNNLALLLSDDEAIELFHRIIAGNPEDVQAVFNLATTLHRLGRVGPALVWYEKARLLSPDSADICFHVGSIHQTLGNLTGAILAYEQAIALKPTFIEALHNLATVHVALYDYVAAEKWYRWALMLDPTLALANRNMVSILEADGRLTEACFFRQRLPRPQALEIRQADPSARAILILSAMGQGNIPLTFLLPAKANTHIYWYVDVATDEQESSLPKYDIAFNAIGNADLMTASMARVSEFHAKRPVLNPPESVARTRRDFLPRLLSGIPNIIIPPVIRLGRAEVLQPDLHQRLKDAGIGFPMLVRPISAQGGKQLTLIETQAELGSHRYTDADAFYFSTYHDYRSSDGYYRKYRTIFIDRVPYHYHLAISPNWLVHYVSSDMTGNAWKLEEEHRFLADPATAIGASACQALAAIGRAMDMDYAGIDYAVLQDGSVLVFEANATMLVHLLDSKDDFPYKHIFVPKIIAAFDAMLTRHQTSTSS